MEQPPGFHQSTSNSSFMCKLSKAICGLKQAPCAWFERLQPSHLLVFTSSTVDSSLFLRFISKSTMFILVYVDDTVIQEALPLKFKL